MFWRIVLPIIVTFVLPNSHLLPVELYDDNLETNDIDSGTPLIDTEDYDYLETSTIDLVSTNTDNYKNLVINTTTDSIDNSTTMEDHGPRITTKASQTNQRNQNKTVILRTLAHDGPLIVEKLEYVKIAEKIPIFFRLVINDNAKESPYIIKSSTLIEDTPTTTESNFNVIF